ncbi:MAG: hemerythrin domain-containing protein [Chromatiaceae bacterium]|nr:hemerythrin domain-containing protein [Chromatiaceae bacterium]
MSAILHRLHQDHVRLGRLLDLFEALLDQIHEGDEPDYGLLKEALDYMCAYADGIHHPTEDLVFQRLLDQGVETPEVFERLMRQHQSLTQVAQRFQRALDAILNEEVLLREDVELDGRELLATMRAHLHLEEEEAFPVALERLTAADWAAIEAAAPAVDDPLAGPDPQQFRALYHYLVEQAAG